MKGPKDEEGYLKVGYILWQDESLNLLQGGKIYSVMHCEDQMKISIRKDQ